MAPGSPLAMAVPLILSRSVVLPWSTWPSITSIGDLVFLSTAITFEHWFSICYCYIKGTNAAAQGLSASKNKDLAGPSAF
jgi:hypothetical protein